MKSLKRKEYDTLLRSSQRELAAVANWLKHSGNRLVVLFEGRDTAGKGGAINAITQYLNPRQCQIVALPRANNREQTQWYFQRYITHLPAAGEMMLFDRSWYNRAGVEKVMKFCSNKEYRAFLHQVPIFEKLLVDDGILLFKYWLTVDQDEQEQRFAERLDNPMKRWKLSSVDLAARDHYDEYTQAREAMLKATHTDYAPWTLVDFNDQKLGRLTLIRNLIDRLPNTETPDTAPKFPPLAARPRKEHFKVLKPIPSLDL
ncbi:MAG: polyphosphate kinase 2 [Xanthomonadaceae bacterium]|jgi:polyphosphate kinase 2|nr:polyphosphate kinase 2 [Xanthomonadaceae bacterium]